MSTLVHINIPRGHYVGQIRLRGHRRWQIVTGECKTPEAAMAKAVKKMTAEHKRARVLFIDSSGWYEPHVAMEASR